MRAPFTLMRSLAALAAAAALLVGCGSSTGGTGTGGGGDSSAGSGSDDATPASTEKATDKPDSTGDWPPSDACGLVSRDTVTDALKESLNSEPTAREGAYGPSCEYYSDVASPIAVVQAFPVEDLKTYTDSLLQRGAVVKTPGIGDSALLQMSNPVVADASLYVFAGSTAFSVQVSVYGGDGTWTGARAQAAATAIAKAIIG